VLLLCSHAAGFVISGAVLLVGSILGGWVLVSEPLLVLLLFWLGCLLCWLLLMLQSIWVSNFSFLFFRLGCL
jgi:hypothetical protein